MTWTVCSLICFFLVSASVSVDAFRLAANIYACGVCTGAVFESFYLCSEH
jgi:hypothetical protein